MVLAVYSEGKLCQLSYRPIDLIQDGVSDVYVETDEIIAENDGNIAKLIILNNLGQLKPYDY